MKRGAINFSVALLAVVVVHMTALVAALVAWPALLPSVPTQQPAVVYTDIVQAAALPPSSPTPATTLDSAPASKPAAAQEQTDLTTTAPTSAPAAIPAAATPAVTLPAAPRLQIPDPMRLHYTVTKGNSTAQAVLTWQSQLEAARQVSTYALDLSVSALFVTLLQQTSTGDITSQGLAPTRYSDKRVRKSEQATHFDSSAGTVTFSNNRPAAPWIAGVQDRLSMLVQLAALASGKAESGKAEPNKTAMPLWRAGDVIVMPVASTDELEPWQWEVQASANTSAAEEAGTVWLLRRPRRAFDARIEVWLAPSVGYLPVRIRQTDSSGVTDQVLERHERSLK